MPRASGSLWIWHAPHRGRSAGARASARTTLSGLSRERAHAGRGLNRRVSFALLAAFRVGHFRFTQQRDEDAFAQAAVGHAQGGARPMIHNGAENRATRKNEIGAVGADTGDRSAITE